MTGKHQTLFITAAGLCLSLIHPVQLYAEETEILNETGTVLFNDNWRFREEGNDWTGVSLPHDWTITHTPDVSGEAESGFLPGGIGTYEKTFAVSEELSDCEFLLEFEGVYHRAHIYINDEEAAYHPYGYTPFTVDLTEFIRVGEDNTLKVICDTSEASSRWYSGSGIYRDVTMHIKEKTYLDETKMQVVYGDLQNETVLTTVKAELINHTGEMLDAEVSAVIYDQYGKICAETVQSVSAEETADLSLSLEVKEPQVWDIEHPVLYTAEVSLLREGNAVDRISTLYGYRTIGFDADTGFYLNGNPVKLKGVCLHHDLGALGACDSRYIWKQRLTQLKEMGCNAVRITHNPASQSLLELCAQMGMLVIEESFDTWTYSKNWNLADYASCFNEQVAQEHLVGLDPGWTWAQADICSMVWAGRNNPAVIMWSIGNEILGNIGVQPEEYPSYAGMLSSWVYEQDTERPVTIGDNMTDGTSEIQNAMDDAVVRSGGVIGLNYADSAEYDAHHTEHPDVVYYGSETSSELSTRGWYLKHGTDQDHLQVSAWDEEAVEWGNTAQQAWLDVITRDYIAGEFIWTGFDYLGEPEPWNGVESGSVSGQGAVPKSSYFGVIDTAGIEKDSYWFYQSQWQDETTVVHILPSWNKESVDMDLLGTVSVTVYSNAPAVELFLNGKSQGIKYAEEHTTEAGYVYRTYDGELSLNWNVRWQSGTLTAAAYDENGNVIDVISGRNTVSTHGKSSSLAFTEKRKRASEKNELMTLHVSAYDENGLPVYNAEDQITFSVSGNAEIVGTDNGNPCDLDPYHSPQRRLFSGTAAVIIKVTDVSGDITVRAESEGLTPAQLTVSASYGTHHPVKYKRSKGD